MCVLQGVKRMKTNKKRMGSCFLFLAMALSLVITVPAAAADGVTYLNNFDPDVFTWSYPTNMPNPANVDGYESTSAKALLFQPATPVNGTAFVDAAFPGSWDLSSATGDTWLKLMAKGTVEGETGTKLTVEIRFMSDNGLMAGSYKLEIISGDWQEVLIKLPALAGAKKVRFYNKIEGKTGSIALDDFTLTTVKPPTATSYTNDFEPGNDQFTWKSGGLGVPANAEGYQSGTAKAISFTETTNQYGWLDMILPDTWDLSQFDSNSNLVFMVKTTFPEQTPVTMELGFRTAADAVLSSCQTSFCSGDWQQVVVPVSTIAGAEKIRFHNQMAGQTGLIILDDFTLTVNLPEGTEVTNLADFDVLTLGAPTVWGASATKYSKAEITEDGPGVDGGKALRFYYLAPEENSSYCGQVFFRPSWSYRYADYVEFDLKTGGNTEVIKLSFVTDTKEFPHGKQYEYRIETDSAGWQHYVVPIDQFQNGGEPVAKDTILGIGISTPVKNGVAKSGEVFFDNLKTTNLASSTPANFTVKGVTVSQNGSVLPALTSAAVGNVTFTAQIGYSLEGGIPVTMLVGIYHKADNTVVGFQKAEAVITKDGSMAVTMQADAPQSCYAKVFFWDSVNSMKPLDAGYSSPRI